MPELQSDPSFVWISISKCMLFAFLPNHSSIDLTFNNKYIGYFQALRQIRKEYRAVNSLMVRSSLPELNGISRSNFSRYLSTSYAKSNENDPGKSKDPPFGSNKDSNKKNNDEKEKVLKRKLLVFLTLLFHISCMCIIYSIGSKITQKEEIVSIFTLNLIESNIKI